LFSDAGSDCGRYARGLVDANEIVMHEMDRDGMSVVLGLFREAIRQPREPPHRHPHDQVLPLNVAGADVRRVRLLGAAI